MELRVFGTLRQFAGAKQVEVDVGDGDTVRNVLERLAAEYPALGEHLLDDAGSLRSSINVLVSGRSISFLDGLESIIQEGDALAIFPAVGGG